MTRTSHGRAAGVLAAAASLLAAGPLAGQQQEEAPPEGWVVVTDRGGHGGGELEFVRMAPGFHITTGPAAIFYHPDRTARGAFRVETEIFLFDPGRRNEGFGLFLGGRDLQGERPVYTYFLIRRDGSVLVKRRDGAETSVLHGWAEHPAVVTWEERGGEDAQAKNVLAVEARADELVFLVNGQEVHRTPREGQHVDGVVGLRVNHALNLHVTRLDVEPIG